MRHNKNFNHLGRQAGHRKALMSNMASSLILHKRIETTVAKAKALLMDKFSLTEPEAHHYLQKNAMDRGLKLTDLAAKILQSNA